MRFVNVQLSFMANSLISVELVYVSLQQQELLISVEVSQGTTVAQLIQQSGILQQLPELSSSTGLAIRVGIFGKLVSLDTVVFAGDRVEIYRPLLIEPKEARRLRAGGKVRKGNK